MATEFQYLSAGGEVKHLTLLSKNYFKLRVMKIAPRKAEFSFVRLDKNSSTSRVESVRAQCMVRRLGDLELVYSGMCIIGEFHHSSPQVMSQKTYL